MYPVWAGNEIRGFYGEKSTSHTGIHTSASHMNCLVIALSPQYKAVLSLAHYLLARLVLWHAWLYCYALDHDSTDSNKFNINFSSKFCIMIEYSTLCIVALPQVPLKGGLFVHA